MYIQTGSKSPRIKSVPLKRLVRVKQPNVEIQSLLFEPHKREPLFSHQYFITKLKQLW